MSRELDEIAREFNKVSSTIFRDEVCLYQSNINQISSIFLKSIEQHCKKNKIGCITLIAVVPNPLKKK